MASLFYLIIIKLHDLQPTVYLRQVMMVAMCCVISHICSLVFFLSFANVKCLRVISKYLSGKKFFYFQLFLFVGVLRSCFEFIVR